MPATHIPTPALCSTCGLSTRDIAILQHHSCDVQLNGGVCEDFPCCGHEQGDCNGLLYGSNDSIRASFERHFECEHEYGFCYAVEDYED